MIKEVFLTRAEKIHKNKYLYTALLDCVKITGIVDIICPCHGIFAQSMHNHLNGSGCPRCSKYTSRGKESFLEKAKNKFGNTFDYSYVKYVGCRNIIDIICPVHGQFSMTPFQHLQSTYGCTFCGREKGCEKRAYDTEIFIRKAKEVHGDKYDYSKVQYIESATKVEIICNKHGSFFQSPVKHLVGQGCSSCLDSHGEKRIRDFLDRHGIDCEQEKRFKTCRDKKPLPFDFFIPDYNMIIEYDGEQHFKSRAFDNGTFKSSLEYTKYHDELKSLWCEENGYTLLRISYLDYERVDDILCEALKIKKPENEESINEENI